MSSASGYHAVRYRLIIAVACVAALVAPLSVAAASAATPKIHNYVYHAAKGNHIEAWWPASSAPIAWVVYVHGGYWYKGDAAQGGPFCRDQAAHGRACFSAGYRLVPEVRWPAPLQDVRADVAWVRHYAAHFNLDPARGYIIGASAGGLMASIVGLTDRKFAGVIVLSGVTDAYRAMRDRAQLSNPRTQTNTLALFDGVQPRRNSPLWRTGCAVDYITTHTKRVRVLVEHGTADVTINIEMSDHFTSTLRAKGFPVTYYRMAGRTHYNLGQTGYNLIDKWISSD